MRYRSVCLFCIAGVLIVSGCSRSGSPVVPSEIGRDAQFWYPAVPVFSEWAGYQGSWDADLATVVYGYNMAPYVPGDVWEQEVPDLRYTWCATVSMYKGIGRALPYYSWMRTEIGSPQGDEPTPAVQQGRAAWVPFGCT